MLLRTGLAVDEALVAVKEVGERLLRLRDAGGIQCSYSMAAARCERCKGTEMDAGAVNTRVDGECRGGDEGHC